MNPSFEYKIIYSARHSIAVQITRDCRVIVRAPKGCSRPFIDGFVHEKEDWILAHLEEARAGQERSSSHPPLSRESRERYIRLARDIFTQKTAYYARIMNVTYGRISIREQKTRWGSCSSKGNLNFNWRLILAPESVLDYVVVHELAHRLEMNHSKSFYSVVESVLPDYRTSRKWLRDNGQSLWEIL